MNHAQIDKLSFAKHAHLVPRLQKDPTLLEEMKRTINSWIERRNCKSSMIYLSAWLEAIENGVDAVVSLSLAPSDRGQVLRSCSPMGVVWKNQKERRDFINEWKESPECKNAHY